MKIVKELPLKCKCSICGKTATWIYLPSTNYRQMYCDDCVPRGCTCNVEDVETLPVEDKTNTIWWSKSDYENGRFEKFSKSKRKNSFYYEKLDEKGRRNPCCEFDYDANGINRYTFELIISTYDILQTWLKVFKKFNTTCMDELIEVSRIKKNKFVCKIDDLPYIKYSEYMTKVEAIFRRKSPSTIIKINANSINCYNSFRSQLYELARTETIVEPTDNYEEKSFSELYPKSISGKDF